MTWWNLGAQVVRCGGATRPHAGLYQGLQPSGFRSDKSKMLIRRSTRARPRWVLGLLMGASFGAALIVGSGAVTAPLVAPPLCAESAHQTHLTVAPDGTRQSTWHPPSDPSAGCAFGHEHGSDPSRFIGAKKVGKPAFGWLAARMGMTEPHQGFKVYVVNDDGRGKAWMIVLHQGTGSPKRAAQAFHSLDIWMVRRRDRALLAEVHTMADFGAAVPDCADLEPPPAARVLPALGPNCSQDYESWTTQLSVGGKLQALGISFGVDNPTTVIDRADPGRLAFNTAAVCGVEDPAGPLSTCKGDRRWIMHPRWVLKNHGPSIFYTDPHGNGASSRPFPGSVRQFVKSGIRIDERRQWSGPSVDFTLAGGSGGGVFRPAQPGRSRGFDTGGDVRWPN